MVSLRICQDGHANSLALSPDQRQIAVAGRSLLKVYSIENDGFSELNNFRNFQAGSQKNHNLSYSSNCVAWNPIESNILATSSTNGSVSLWDLKKFGRQKQLFVYNEHERTTHTVTFHQTDANLLISGSQDGMIKLFDLRQEKSVSTFFSTESVRDCKFNPQSANFFAAVSENGTVQFWDIRKPDRCNFQFTAHSGPIYTCDFHPTQSWLATGSRDKQIKIWNISTNKPPTTPPIYTIHTIAVVGRVKWRPERKFHIASTATVVDYSIYIWDVRRPFIPYASFVTHTNIVTDIAFKGNDPHTLLSTSKDSTIYKHSSENAEHPASKTNPQGATINYKGDMVFVCKTKNVIPVALASSTSKLNFLNKKTSIDVVDSPREEFHLAKSNIHSFSMHEKALSPLNSKSSNDSTLKTTLAKDFNFLKGCALEYKLTGAGFFELCDINAAVAKKFGKMNVYHLWCYVKNIYLSTKFTIENPPTFNRLSAQNSNQSSSGLSVLTRASGSFGTAGLTAAVASGTNTVNNTEDNPEAPTGGLNRGSSSSDLGEIIETCNEMVSNTTINDCDFVFDEKELTIENIDCVKNFRNGFLYTGPHDLLKELSFPSCSSSFDLQQTNNHFKNHNNRRNDIVIHREQETSPPPDLAPTILCVPETRPPSPWTPYQVIADCLMLQCEIGDVQTATCILIVLGDKRDDLLSYLDKNVHEMWLQAYVDLLHKFQMWNQATEIMNLSWIPNISEMNNNSTIVHTTCGECGRVLQGPGWYCKYCKSMEPARCVVCNLVVRGVFAFCSICNHGGHLEHLKEWYYLNLNCPKCGCACEYD